MRTVIICVISYVDDSEKIEEWAVNNDREGLFRRRPDGTWHQLKGTGQFYAKSPADMMRKIRKGYAEKGVVEMRMVRNSAWNWDR